MKKLVEFWRWRYRDPSTGKIGHTNFQMSEAESIATLAEPERIRGSMSRREVEVDDDDTSPGVFRASPEE